jgi:HME family heavy-metal exporter
VINSPLLDTFTTPVLFELFGERALTQGMTTDARLAYETF